MMIRGTIFSLAEIYKQDEKKKGNNMTTGSSRPPGTLIGKRGDAGRQARCKSCSVMESIIKAIIGHVHQNDVRVLP